MDTAFAKVVRTANGPAILIGGYVIGVSPPPELHMDDCVDAIVSGLRGQGAVVGGPEPIYARLTPELLPSLDHLGGFTLHPVETSETAE